MTKPYFHEGGITIYQGDATEILPELETESVDLVLTDPPYNIGYSYGIYKDAMDDADYFQWQLEMVEQTDRILKTSGSFIYLHYPEFAARVWAAAPEISGLRPMEWVTWVYHTHTGGVPLRKASRAWLWFVKGEPFVNVSAFDGEYRNPSDKRVAALIKAGRKPGGYDWWEMEQVKNVSAEKTEHPCQVPIAMVSRWLKGTLPEGGVVLDPFLGSGTTLRAAKDLGRKAIGIEIEERYCEIAAKRMSQAVLL